MRERRAQHGKQVALAIPALAMGGAPRSVASISAGLADAGYAVSVLACTDPSEDEVELSPLVERVVVGERLHRSNRFVSHAGRVHGMHRWLARHGEGVVISFERTMNSTCRLAVPATEWRLVMSERSNPFQQPASSLGQTVRRLSYQGDHLLVVQTDDLARDLRRVHPRANITVIPNFLDPAFVDRLDAAHRGERERTVVSLGRLVELKGFATLIRAFATAHLAADGWRLRIVGEGPDETTLRGLADELGITAAFDLVPFTSTPEEEYSRAGVVAVASRHEGFCNVLLEALATGAPAVTTDCRYGARELADDGRAALVVPVDDVRALATALRDLADHDGRRDEMGRVARDVRTRFSRSAVIDRWIDVVERRAGRR